jgi:uncharacterized protein involved in high-affinity Fe2+ transport
MRNGGPATENIVTHLSSRLSFVVLAAILSSIVPAVAKEFYVGEPVIKNDMQLVPHYLLGIEMAPMVKGMAMGPNAVHLEIDVHATREDKRGFKEDEWHDLLHHRERRHEVQENRTVFTNDSRRWTSLRQ